MLGVFLCGAVQALSIAPHSGGLIIIARPDNTTLYSATAAPTRKRGGRT